ncbi:hypothetical protein SAMN05192586_10884 [Desulfovibrio legallii]|uniref:Uncharacterized protein n=1 Tax=Desulfovibrio legallii TaxID=571438 RepID=A0A1G7MCB8_9BACT|nr:hypothetical protein SAMN05192586_10884 [Desulfovibrio legallii]
MKDEPRPQKGRDRKKAAPKGGLVMAVSQMVGYGSIQCSTPAWR